MNLKTLCPLFLFALFAVCNPAQAQTNNPATGMPAVTYVTGITVPTEDSAITAAQGTIADTDGLGTLSWQWSQADANGGTYTDIAMATNTAFTPGDDEVGKFLQVCASFMDMATTPNSEERCLQIATAVANVSDRPTTSSNAVFVSTAADADNPFVFKISDFPFADVDDGDMLGSVTISRLPSNGTMALDGTALTDVPENPITAAQLTAGALTYYPASGQEPSDPDDITPAARYAGFRFRVTDDSSDNAISSDMHIRLVAPAQTAASGNPATQPLITDENPTYMVGTQLTATTSGIDEPNNINRDTLMWEWQSSSASDGTFTAIASATAITFTPTQALAGQYLRFCVRFMDRHPTPVQEGPLCSIPAQVGDVTTPSGTDTDIGGQEVIAILAPTAIAANAIADAISTAAPNDLSLDGTSLMGTARTLGQSTTTDTDGHTAWFHGTTASWEYNAAYNSSDNSADSLLHRLQSMAAGDIAMSWQAGGSAMRFWARYQSTDISGNEGETLEYDGSGSGFYIGADRRINDKMRLGLAISSDSADITLNLDEHGTDDEATRSATTIYPYLQMDLGGNNHLSVIAGIGSGDLDIKSTANGSTASAGLSMEHAGRQHISPPPDERQTQRPL